MGEGCNLRGSGALWARFLGHSFGKRSKSLACSAMEDLNCSLSSRTRSSVDRTLSIELTPWPADQMVFQALASVSSSLPKSILWSFLRSSSEIPAALRLGVKKLADTPETAAV